MEIYMTTNICLLPSKHKKCACCYHPGVAKEDQGEVGICAICGGQYAHGGYNPNPIIADENARCCGCCNHRFVVPKRIKIMIKEYISQKNK